MSELPGDSWADEPMEQQRALQRRKTADAVSGGSAVGVPSGGSAVGGAAVASNPLAAQPPEVAVQSEAAERAALLARHSAMLGRSANACLNDAPLSELRELAEKTGAGAVGREQRRGRR